MYTSLLTCAGALTTCVGLLLELQQLIFQEISFFLLKSETPENSKEVIIIIMRTNQVSFKESVGPNAYSRKSQPLDISESSRQDRWHLPRVIDFPVATCVQDYKIL